MNWFLFAFAVISWTSAVFFAGAFLGIRRGVADMNRARVDEYEKKLAAETKAHEDRLTIETEQMRERIAIQRGDAPPAGNVRPFVVPPGNSPA